MAKVIDVWADLPAWFKKGCFEVTVSTGRVRYAPTVVGGLKVLGQKPVAVYVEKVYDEGNFADLGIGT